MLSALALRNAIEINMKRILMSTTMNKRSIDGFEISKCKKNGKKTDSVNETDSVRK